MAHNKDKIIPGQGSQLNTHNRFDKLDRSGEAIYNDEPYNEDEGDKEKTQYTVLGLIGCPLLSLQQSISIKYLDLRRIAIDE